MGRNLGAVAARAGVAVCVLVLAGAPRVASAAPPVIDQPTPVQPPGVGGSALTVLNYAAWGLFFSCVAALIVGGIFIAWNAWSSHGQGAQAAFKKIMWPLVGGAVGSSASLLVALFA